MKSHFRGALTFLGSTIAAVALTSCMLDKQKAGETRVGQGKAYQSDNRTYDEFFEDVHAVEVRTAAALDEEAKARAPLEHALGTRSTTPERLVELTKARVKKGREEAPLHFVVSGLDADKEGEKKVLATVTVPDEASIPSSQRDLVKALEESAKSEAEIAAELGPVAMKARRLSARQGQLVKSVSRDFTTPSRRDEVSHELGASKVILDGASERAERASNNARSFLKGMASAFPPFSDTTPASKDDKPNSNKSSEKPKRSSPRPTPPKTAKTPPAQAPRPEPIPTPAPPAKAPSEDFNP
jgi:hypothetical protein